MPTGVIKKFFPEKGFGFITPDDGGDAIFVHRKIYGNGKDKTAYIDAGELVTYEVEWDTNANKWSASSCTGWKTGGGDGGGNDWNSWGGGGGSWNSGGDSWGKNDWSKKQVKSNNQDMKPGDWSCPKCGDHQFAKNVTCRQCGAPKPSGSEGLQDSISGQDPAAIQFQTLMMQAQANAQAQEAGGDAEQAAQMQQMMQMMLLAQMAQAQGAQPAAEPAAPAPAAAGGFDAGAWPELSGGGASGMGGGSAGGAPGGMGGGTPGGIDMGALGMLLGQMGGGDRAAPY